MIQQDFILFVLFVFCLGIDRQINQSHFEIGWAHWLYSLCFLFIPFPFTALSWLAHNFLEHCIIFPIFFSLNIWLFAVFPYDSVFMYSLQTILTLSNWGFIRKNVFEHQDQHLKISISCVRFYFITCNTARAGINLQRSWSYSDFCFYVLIWIFCNVNIWYMKVGKNLLRVCLLQMCRVPNKHILAFRGGQMGCFTVLFSRAGTMLAAACADRDAFPVIGKHILFTNLMLVLLLAGQWTCNNSDFIAEKENKKYFFAYFSVYEIPSGKVLAAFSGHLKIVYDLCWSRDDTSLLSASSDGTVR